MPTPIPSAIPKPTYTTRPIPTRLPTSTPLPTPKQKVKIHWFVDEYASWPHVYEAETWADDFNRSQEDIELVVVVFDGHWDTLATLFARKAEGQDVLLPDLIWYMAARSYALRDVWLDLTPYLQDYDLSIYNQNALRDWQDEDGRQLGLPLTINAPVIVYNRDLFDAAGVPYPPHRYGEPYADGEAWSIEKLEEIAIQLTLDGNGRTPTQPGFDAQDIAQFGFAPQWLMVDDITALFGSELQFDASGGVRLPDSWREAMRWYYAGMWEKHFIPNEKQVHDDLGVNPFDSGQVAMVYTYSWYPQCCLRTTINWDMAALPAYNGRVSGAAPTAGYGVLKTSNHPQEAVQALYYLFAQNEILPTDLGVPAQTSEQADYFSKLDERFPQGVDWQVAADSLIYPEILASAFKTTQNTSIWNRLSDFQETLGTTADLELDAAFDDLVDDLKEIVSTK